MDLGRLQKLSDEELLALLPKIVGNKDLPRRPYPIAPAFSAKTPTLSKLYQIQQFINSFEYNHTGISFVKKRKDRGLSHIFVTAKELIRIGMPLQCVEAVFLAIFLTQDFADITMFPLSFKSSVQGQVYRHIVSAVNHGGKWGALGISRSDALMWKDISFNSLADLVLDFKKSYEMIGHDLVRVYVGLPCSSDLHPSGSIKWRALKCSMSVPWAETEEALRAFSRDGRRLLEHANRTGRLPDDFRRSGSGPTADDDNSEPEGSDTEGPKQSKPPRVFGV